jgi:hypothetical protein
MPPPPGVADPIGVLRGILGVPVNIDKRAKTARGAEKDEVVMPDIEDARGIDFGELSLEEFAAKGERKREYTERTAEECEFASPPPEVRHARADETQTRQKSGSSRTYIGVSRRATKC